MWREFIVTIWQPLLTQLVREKWIDAIPMTASDALGRQKFAVYGHRIAALVVCRGVPLKIAHAAEFLTEVLPLTTRGEFRTNARCGRCGVEPARPAGLSDHRLRAESAVSE